MKKWQASLDRWSHDRFDESEQAPKSRSELVSSYGYDIRNEDGPPKARRRRRYGRGATKYSRNWEDEDAYKKQTQQATQMRKPPRPEDFPELEGGGRGDQPPMRQKQVRRTRTDRTNKRNSGSDMGRGGGGGSSGDNEPRRRHNDENDQRGRQSMYGDDRSAMQPQNQSPQVQPFFKDNRVASNNNNSNNSISNRRSMQSSERDRNRFERDRGFRGGREFKNQNRNKNNENQMPSLSPPPHGQNYGAARGGDGGRDAMLRSNNMANLPYQG